MTQKEYKSQEKEKKGLESIEDSVDASNEDLNTTYKRVKTNDSDQKLHRQQNKNNLET